MIDAATASEQAVVLIVHGLAFAFSWYTIFAVAVGVPFSWAIKAFTNR